MGEKFNRAKMRDCSQNELTRAASNETWGNDEEARFDDR